MLSLLPWRQARSVYDLTGESLERAGVQLLMADLDNTLCPYSAKEPDQALRDWLADLESHGVTLFLLSNSRKPKRPAHFAQALGIPYLGRAGKPKVGGFVRTMRERQVEAGACAMVGDQIFTDILGANRAGVRSILVEPISLAGNPGRYLRYWAELPVRFFSRGRRWSGERSG